MESLQNQPLHFLLRLPFKIARRRKLYSWVLCDCNSPEKVEDWLLQTLIHTQRFTKNKMCSDYSAIDLLVINALYFKLFAFRGKYFEISVNSTYNIKANYEKNRGY